jgi:hypothetical protein
MEIQAQTMASMPRREPWNKGKLIGEKPPLRPKHVWSIRTRSTKSLRDSPLRRSAGAGTRIEIVDSGRVVLS